MKATTVITITAADLLSLIRSKGFLTSSDTPAINVASTTGWMTTTQNEVVQVSYTRDEAAPTT